MVYWRILTSAGQTGYQVMDNDRSNAALVDDDGAPLTGNFDYHVTDTDPALPVWANA